MMWRTICPHCGNPLLIIEKHWSGKWYNCYRCGFEEPLDIEEVKALLLQEEQSKKAVGRGPSSKGIRLG